MIRNLMTLALALMALFALSAVAASAASAANGQLTSTGPVTLDMFEIAGELNAGTAFGGKTECVGSTATGHKYNVTPHELIPSGAETITVTHDFNQAACFAEEGGTKHKLTVTMEGCDEVIHIGETTEGSDTYKTTADIVCPTGKSIIEDVYFSASNENLKVCEITIGPQTGLAGPTVKDETNGDLEIHGTVTGIHESRTGVCGSATTEGGANHVDATVKGTNSLGENTNISLSHS